MLRVKGRRDCQERIRRVELIVSADAIMFVGISSFEMLEKFDMHITKQNFLALEPPTRTRGYFLKVILCRLTSIGPSAFARGNSRSA